MQSFEEIVSRIPANKFYPPRMDAAAWVFREKLLTETIPQRGDGWKLLAVEAQAGQGKTTLVIQYLQHHDLLHGWYQVGAEDCDPYLFVSSLLACLTKALPGFSSPALESFLTKGSLTALDLARAVNVLLADMDSFVGHDFFLVLDDLHLLEGHHATCSLLRHLLETAPPKCRFILISRRPLAGTLLSSKISGQVLRLVNEDLALTDLEAFDLFHRSLGVSISREELHALLQATGGWIMGLITAARERPGDRGKKGLWRFSDGNSRLREYFEAEVATQLPAETLGLLLRLSFLEEIQVDLAEKITGAHGIGPRLAELRQRNFFVRSLDDSDTLFGLHHLFGEFLQKRARRELSKQEIQALLHMAADHALEEKMIARALRYFLLAGAYEAMEEVLRREGILFIAFNQVATLASLLERVPEPERTERSWLALCGGLVRMELEPEAAFEMLEKARKGFMGKKDEYGELLSISLLVHHHFASSGLFREGAELLPRAEELFSAQAGTMEPLATIMVAKNIATGFGFLKMDYEKTMHYAGLSLELAKRHRCINFIASSLFVRGYIKHLYGKRALQMTDMEQGYNMLSDPHVGLFTCMSIHVLHLNDLETHGDFANFRRQESELFDRIGNRVITQTIAGPIANIWNAIILIAQGRMDEALAVLDATVDHGRSARNPHTASQILQWRAYILGARGEKEEAIRLVDESQRLRKIAETEILTGVNDMIAGATFSQLGLLDRAEEHLARAVRIEESAGSGFFEAVARLHHAYNFLRQGKGAAAHEDIRKSLEYMERSGLEHFWFTPPETVLAVLQEAVDRHIAARFARRLAARRHFVVLRPGKEPIPVLKIGALGRLTVAIGEKTVLEEDDFTPAQRQLLALLLAAPRLKLDQERIQWSLWPESAPQKARYNLDTLLLRMRRTLNGVPGSRVQAANYITLQRGIVKLTNVWTDAGEFLERARDGLALSRRQAWWQAGNSFHSALLLWKGPLALGAFDDEQVREYAEELRHVYLGASRTWAEHLAGHGRPQGALSLVEAALRHDRMNDRLIGLLYGLHLRTGNPLGARKALKEYEELLRSEEYSPEEIAQAVKAVTAPPEAEQRR